MMQKGRVERKIEGQKKEGRKERDGLVNRRTQQQLTKLQDGVKVANA